MASNLASADRCRWLLSLALIVFLGLATHVVRADVSVDINPYVNANIQTYTGGNNYPLGGTTLTNAGVSFTLADGPGLNPLGTGIIQTPPGTSSFDISVSIPNPTAVYTLINSAFGAFGSTVGSVEFKATGGLDYTVNLVEGQDIRDHFNDGFQNIIGTGPLGNLYIHTFAFVNMSINPNGPDRFDEQQFVLPSSFNSATLTDIILHGNGGFPQGEPFLAAATVATPSMTVVPEPSSLVTVGLVVGMVSVWRWRRHRQRS
jgi:hypothetical protein